MKIKEQKTLAILLRKTLMADDDGVLEFFTDKFGRITVFVKKLAKSKKKNLEIDFFRLLELVIFEGRNSKSLRSVSTISVFHTFEKSYSTNEAGFLWIEKLRNILPEEKPLPNFFSENIKLLGNIESGSLEKYNAFFRTKCLDFGGILPYFNQIRQTFFFDAQNSKISRIMIPNALKISNTSRQILEFLRRSDFQTFQEKVNNLPDENFTEVNKVIAEIEKYHE